MEIRITDADGFGRMSPNADLAIVIITRADIEAFQVGSTVERLMLFSDDAKQVMRFAGRMLIQVEGYDNDLRPLVLIPECVRFFRAVDAQWSYWLHFLLPLPDQLNLILLMLLEVEPLSRDGPAISYQVREPEQLGRLLHRLFHAMNTLHETYGVPHALNEAMSAAVATALGLNT